MCAQDIFQKKVDETFGDLPGVTGIADDVVVCSKTRLEHDTNFRAVMERAKNAGIRFNVPRQVHNSLQQAYVLGAPPH